MSFKELVAFYFVFYQLNIRNDSMFLCSINLSNVYLVNVNVKRENWTHSSVGPFSGVKTWHGLHFLSNMWVFFLPFLAVVWNICQIHWWNLWFSPVSRWVKERVKFLAVWETYHYYLGPYLVWWSKYF